MLGGSKSFMEAGIRTLVYLGGIGFVYLSIVERIVGVYGGFIERASEVARGGLLAALEIQDGNDPKIKGLVIKWGDDIVGLIIYQRVPPVKLPRNGSSIVKPDNIEIKAFTVKLVYRRQGLGRELLDRVLDKEVRRGVTEMGFAKDNVNQYHFVPAWLRGGLDMERERLDAWLKRRLEDKLEEMKGKDKGKKKD